MSVGHTIQFRRPGIASQARATETATALIAAPQPRGAVANLSDITGGPTDFGPVRPGGARRSRCIATASLRSRHARLRGVRGATTFNFP